jgi:murein DD-endopeptidase MepM/ murein hydrolase activator NlpD
LNNGLTAAVDTFLSRVAHTIAHHPKHVTALVAALMLGGGGGAYAVASLAPDAADLPVQQIVEAVDTLPLQAQVDLLDAHGFNLFRSDITRSTDTAEALLQRLGINDPVAAGFLRNDAHFRTALLGRAGRTVTAEASDTNELLRLSARWAPEDDGQFTRLVIEKTPQGLASRLEKAPLAASSRLGSGTIKSSLFAATDESRIPDAVAVQVAEIFSGDIDFHRALRKGDRFSVVYESLEADGEPLRTGRVLSAEFVNNGKTYQAMWFQEPGSKGGYYTLDGQSLRRAYLASPMEFSRVTSGFKMRFHPILQKWRAHLGVDYAAPTGTPVRSVGDGVVEFVGVQNGFGNVVFVQHRNQHVTVYAHLSRINVRRGQSVSQGQNLGAVGSTGWATGPHLHFEFRVGGQHQDPMTIAKQSESIPVSAATKPLFDKTAMGMRLQLSAAGSVQQASAQ